MWVRSWVSAEGTLFLPSCVAQEDLWLLAWFRPQNKLLNPQMTRMTKGVWNQNQCAVRNLISSGHIDRKHCFFCRMLWQQADATRCRAGGDNSGLKLNFPLAICQTVSVWLTAGDDAALLSCLRFCLCIRMELLQAYHSSGWIQNHWALVNGDVARPADGVGGRTPDGRLVVWRNIVWTVCIELEHAKHVLEELSCTLCSLLWSFALQS